MKAFKIISSFTKIHIWKKIHLVKLKVDNKKTDNSFA